MRRFESDYKVYVSPANRIAAGLLAGALLVVAITAVWYGLTMFATGAKEILVSVVAGAASLLSAVFTYAFQRAKDVELAAIQKRRELEISERKAKQDNYTRILERLAPYIRDPTEAADQFTTAYLQTWVTGSDQVVRRIDAFLNERNDLTLDNLLHAMRADLSLESSDRLEGLTSKKLFPAPPPPPRKEGLPIVSP